MPEGRTSLDEVRSAGVDRARTPLLTLITQESLDQDYQHVAERKRADADGGKVPTGRPRWVAATVVAAFGLLVAVAAVQTSAGSEVASASKEELRRQIKERGDEVAALQGDLVRQRAENIALEDELDAVTAEERAAANRVQRLGATTGHVPVSGPGVVVTVDDAPNGEPVRDEDLARLVNGLWEAGAEAISINGKRLTGRSALRNAGAAINLNGPPPMSPPYVVSAIGDRRSLEADLLDTTTGLRFFTIADALGFQVEMDSVDDLDLPAATLRRLRSVDTGEDPELSRQKEPLS